MIPLLRAILASVALAAAQANAAGITVTDDAGAAVHLDAPAARIVSLAPGLTELLFDAGAGDRIVATVRHSDYPPAAARIPRIGDAHAIDLEALLVLAPDLVVVWDSGTGVQVRRRLQQLGLRIYRAEPDSPKKIASNMRRLGALAGSPGIADREAARLLAAASALQRRYAGAARPVVFYQFWDEPIYTVNGTHLIGRIIELCGGVNAFGGLTSLTPRLNREAVLAAEPDLIIASGEDAGRPPWLDGWRRWPELKAVSHDHLYTIPPDLLQRPTARIIQGAEMMCGMIDAARPAD